MNARPGFVFFQRMAAVMAVGVMVAFSMSAYAEDVDAMRGRIAELEAQLVERDARILHLETRLAACISESESVATRQAQLDERERALEAMAGAVATGELAERYLSQVKVEYDRKRGRSVVSAGPLWFENESLVGDFFASAVYSVPGKEPVGQPESVSLFLQGEFSGRQFEGVEAVTFVESGEALELPVEDYQQTRKRSGLAGKNRADKGDETLTFVVDVPTLRRLAEATSLVAITPDGPLVWSREQRALLRALLLRMEDAAAATVR